MATSFHDVERAVAGVPFMSAWQGRQVFDHLQAAGCRDVLELGTAHGVSTAYMAAAVRDAGGSVTTVDRHRFAEPSPEELLDRAGVRAAVRLERVEHSSYAWWLREQVRRRTGADGACEPAYDFCYLDGAHDWHVDGLAVVLVERLLRTGGWLLMDDLDWTYARAPTPEPPNLSEDERTTPHLREVFELLVVPNPAFTEFRVQDGTWGWARKGTGERRRVSIETTRTERSITAQRLRLAAQRGRRRLLG